jgi:hypothetical protein
LIFGHILDYPSTHHRNMMWAAGEIPYAKEHTEIAARKELDPAQ